MFFPVLFSRVGEPLPGMNFPFCMGKFIAASIDYAGSNELATMSDFFLHFGSTNDYVSSQATAENFTFYFQNVWN